MQRYDIIFKLQTFRIFFMHGGVNYMLNFQMVTIVSIRFIKILTIIIQFNLSKNCMVLYPEEGLLANSFTRHSGGLRPTENRLFVLYLLKN